MVTATQAVLVTCDVPTREYLSWLDKQVNQSGYRQNPFIIRELDDKHLLIREDMVDFVHQQVKAFNNKNVYTPPVEQQ